MLGFVDGGMEYIIANVGGDVLLDVSLSLLK